LKMSVSFKARGEIVGYVLGMQGGRDRVSSLVRLAGKGVEEGIRGAFEYRLSHDCIDLVQRRPQRRIDGRRSIALLGAKEREEVAHVLCDIVLRGLVDEKGPFVGVGHRE